MEVPKYEGNSSLEDLDEYCLMNICKYLDSVDQIAMQIAYTKFDAALRMHFELTQSLVWDSNQLDINHSFYNYLTRPILQDYINTIGSSLEKFEITPNVCTGFDMKLVNIILNDCVNLRDLRFLGYATRFHEFGDNSQLIKFPEEIYWKIVSNLTQIELIELSCLFVGDEDILILSQITNLEHLVLCGNEGVSGKYLDRFRQLKTLHLNPCVNLGFDYIISVFKVCPELRSLDLSGSLPFGDGITAVLAARCPNLEELYITLDEELTFNGLEDIAELRHLNSVNIIAGTGHGHYEKCSYLLTKLLMNGAADRIEKLMTIGFDTIFDVVTKYTKLTTLLLRHNENLYDASIWQKLKNLPDLQNFIVPMKLKYLNEDFYDFLSTALKITKISIICPLPRPDGATAVASDSDSTGSGFRNYAIHSALNIGSTDEPSDGDNNEARPAAGQAATAPEIENYEADDEAEIVVDKSSNGFEHHQPSVQLKWSDEVANELDGEPDSATEADDEADPENSPKISPTDAQETDLVEPELPAVEDQDAEQAAGHAELPRNGSESDDGGPDADAPAPPKVIDDSGDILDENFIENIVGALRTRHEVQPITAPMEFCIIMLSTLPEKENILNDPSYVDNKSLLDLIILDN